MARTGTDLITQINSLADSTQQANTEAMDTMEDTAETIHKVTEEITLATRILTTTVTRATRVESSATGGAASRRTSSRAWFQQASETTVGKTSLKPDTPQRNATE